MEIIGKHAIEGLDRKDLFTAVYVSFSGDYSKCINWLQGAELGDTIVDEFLEHLPAIQEADRQVFVAHNEHYADIVIKEALEGADKKNALAAAALVLKNRKTSVDDADAIKKGFMRLKDTKK